MIAILSGVVRNIVILVILVSILDMLLPRKDFRPFINMVVGLVLMLMLLQPLRSVMQLPGLAEPFWELRQTISDRDIAVRTARLEQVNWEMTLSQYRSLIGEKIGSILQTADLEVYSLQLALEEDVSHLEFGTPRQIIVMAKKTRPASQVEPVQRVRVQVGALSEEESRGERDRTLEIRVAEALGVAKSVVEVWIRPQE